MALTWPNKDPDDILDYSIDWSSFLGNTDIITDSSWILPDGLIEDSNSFSNTVTTVWLSSGANNVKYSVTNRIVTDEGRQRDQSVILLVKAN